MENFHGHCSGYAQTSVYAAWAAMKARCNNPKNPNYHHYGGRGITYQKSWEEFLNFLKDMGEPLEGLSLERVDNEKGYTKENCKWATQSEQCLNKRMDKRNTSGRKGVSYYTGKKSWVAEAMKGGKKYRLYCGPSFEEACKAREAWELANGVPYYGS